MSNSGQNEPHLESSAKRAIAHSMVTQHASVVFAKPPRSLRLKSCKFQANLLQAGQLVCLRHVKICIDQICHRLSDVDAGRAGKVHRPSYVREVHVARRREVPCCAVPAQAVWRELHAKTNDPALRLMPRVRPFPV